MRRATGKRWWRLQGPAALRFACSGAAAVIVIAGVLACGSVWSATPPSPPDAGPLAGKQAEAPPGKPPDAAPGANGPSPIAIPGSFEDFDDRGGYPTAEELRKALLPVAGNPLEIAEARKHDRPIRRVGGLARLGIPWPAGHALRLGLCDANPFQIHLWNGQDGITLRYHPEFLVWAAYATQRQEGGFRPSDYVVLLATSGDLYSRSGLGTVEVQYRQGRLYLARGELVLLDVPCSFVPAEVYFDGIALLRGLAVVPAKEPPSDPGPWPLRRPTPPSPQSSALAGRAWTKTPADGVHVDTLATGGVELWVDGKTPLVQAGVPLGRPELWDLMFEVESPSPGTGIYLGDAEGRQLARVGFLRHRETGKVVFDLVPAWSNEAEKSYNLNRQPVPFFGNRRWLRVVCGAAVVRLWTSVDGKSWSPIAPLSLGLEGPCSTVGLYCLPGQGKRSIRLHALEVARLDAFDKWDHPAAEAAGPALRKAATLEAWRKAVLEAQPADIPWHRWWRACAVRTLAENPRRNVAQGVLDRLVVAELQTPGQLSERLRLLRQAVALLSGEDTVASGEAWRAAEQLDHWAKVLGGTMMRGGHPRVFTEMSRALMGLPYWHGRRFSVFSEAWLRQELFAAMSAGRWEDIRALAQRLRYYGGGALREGEPLWGPALEYLLSWAETAVGYYFGQAESKAPAGGPRRPQRWLHPFLEPSEREAFNTLAEFYSAVDSQAWSEACQLLAGVGEPQALGLHADRRDPQWLLSFPLAVELAARAQPALRQMMQEKFGGVGRLRLKQAAASGSAQAVLAVVHQFPGTEIAAEARRWLGDRELSAGRAVEALAHYRRALPDTPAEERAGLSARMRLAAAMMGIDLGGPPERGVQLGGTWFSPAQFEAMVQQARKAHAPSAFALSGDKPSVTFPPGRYEARAVATFEQAATPRPAWIGPRMVDWFGQQLNVALTPEGMVVGTRASLALLRPADGQWLWSQRAEVREDRHQPVLVPMQLQVVGKRVFVRRLSNEGTELACVDLAEGKLLWSVRPDSYAASDPVFIGSQLLALTAAHEGAEKVSLWLANIRPASGRVRLRHHLADFRDAANWRLECQVAVSNDLLIAVGGGVVLCCDSVGRVRWVRRQIWTPPPMKEYSVARAWFDHLPEPPLVLEGKVYATQPGVWGLEAMDLESGRLLWRVPMGTLLRMAGGAQGRLVVQTADGVVAMDANSGAWIWDRACGPCFDVRLCGPAGPVVVLVPPQRETRPPGLPEVEWFDLHTGRPVGRSELALPSVPPGRVEVWLRPLVFGNSRQWLLAGTPRNPAQRKIYELVRVGEVGPPVGEDSEP